MAHYYSHAHYDTHAHANPYVYGRNQTNTHNNDHAYTQADTRDFIVATEPTQCTHTPCLWGNGTCRIALDDLSPSGLTRHLKAFHFNTGANQWDNKRRGMCAWGSHCDAQEMNFESFGKHIAAVHLRSTAQRCPRCGRGFARGDTLTRHMLENCPYADE
ncbi:uncharacterized protein FIBRA_06508 [Fibroporia radiculosa]|uniref:C2H2-type domain-containing protein n=1 Tax=Fibroporia radiculosa TaxID=599839 RepID=J4IBA8_9APHY|nr:uncharacterized protein FIBRA_06508 [Fibroporia radiculosa]CCM04336.1 predicted protein [Fibroporia radiculosa]